VEAAKRSIDPDTKLGACVVDERHALVSTGFNGPPRTVDDATVPLHRPDKYAWMVHAEMNALIFALAAMGRYMLDGCTLYSSGTVCSKCMLIAAHVGVKRVVCGPVAPRMCDPSDTALSLAIASAAGVEVLAFISGRDLRPLRRPRDA
jgi:dCMP deaminase